MSTRILLVLTTAMLGPVGAAAGRQVITVGSKAFTEGVILGELVTLLIRDAGFAARHRRELGGTQFVWRALLRGDIDAYVDYTGTLREEIFAGTPLPNRDALAQQLARFDVRMSEPLGFNNTYAFAMKEGVAEELGVQTISDLRAHPDLAFGFTNEFLARGDGWASLNTRYRLPHRRVNGLEHDLAYRGLESGEIQVMDIYSTDAEIAYYGLRVLEDDLNHFPTYSAVIVYRDDLDPLAVAAVRRLEGRLSEADMVRLNARAKLDGTPEARVAADFLSERLEIESQVEVAGWVDRLRRNTADHLLLVGVSLSAAIAIAIPLGIAASLHTGVGQVVLSTVGVIQTIPSLALLVFMIPLLGIGAQPAIVALFLYSLLPIVRNTYTGLTTVPDDIRESAEALGLPRPARLRLVELPIASQAIIAGIKTSAVINVGTATLGALIGAGGYGQPILTGIRLDNVGLILEGAIPAAVLALMVQGLFDLSERFWVPRGLRLARA